MKISIGQIMAELLCRDNIEDTNYEIFVSQWNKISESNRNDIIHNLKNYIVKYIGVKNVED